jgi:hypothetical protein
MEKIKELVERLLAAFEVTNQDEIIANCTQAFFDTEAFIKANDLNWLPDHSPVEVLNFALPGEITHWMVYGDKIDEIHEKLADQLEEGFPGFPYALELDTPGYFKWLEKQLAEKETGLTLIEIGNSFSDELQVLFVNTEEATRILSLSGELNVRCRRATDIAVL